MKRLAIVITHPIQYYVPVFQMLAQKCHLKVFYTWGKAWLTSRYDPGFEKTIEWDIPLLEGYDFEFVENISAEPGSHHTKGIVNPTIINEIKRFGPDAILVHGYSYKSHLLTLRHFKGKVPVWFRGDSTLLNEKNSLKSILKKVYLTWVFNHLDKAFYVGTNSKAYFKKFGLKENQLIFSPHAVDNKRFGIAQFNAVSALKKKLGIRVNDVVILYAGKFEAVKNLTILINAFKLIDSNSKNIKLLLVGNGPQEELLKVLANDDKRIIFMDFQNQTYLPVIYQTCDLFCLPSNSETWGLAINEAMAAGKAILASDKVGCAVDLVTAKNGKIFRSGDLSSLTETLKIMAKDKNQLQQFGLHSSQIIKNWSFEQQVAVIIQQLHELQ